MPISVGHAVESAVLPASSEHVGWGDSGRETTEVAVWIGHDSSSSSRGTR